MTQTDHQLGFTLIELMIVVAIIGILAVVAIPEFAVYRVKALNAAALSDRQTLGLTEETLYGDNQNYGYTGTTPGEIGDGANTAMFFSSRHSAPITFNFRNKT
ncbi:MAG: hypothetical protein CO186_11765 [Zetaproteobacteria bacterium CG_4_9_14_3_um_filter_49_83]|nr:MAG: hypothetical protein AUJ56_10180 [Zetaproteobacteria bacterium CG1_02_49_23]PIQ34396.1 MAG: hypothetical protein COW62_01635 [Zetaproteobacteria bacterium CG17_big_fil_post_rev_8_21_14_2_50_50_13]PIV30288.1 MAG: hypothetical protein COS35_07570 [Zetaproteobacteria bacterium CG02_land_8_20_14_3_00_50_9]PIY56380.1 MAG: hypothetical protein COZ00_04125 [Zetaproteobacteria bacterium CG_4_10_14_0_8_um_filter_49_80]PJA34020.1 MAG: hypothetical protein CO186_11765 [Zetaproteobacteria bacterium